MYTRDKKLAVAGRIPGRGTNRSSYWLIFKGDGERLEALTTRFPDGGEALPVFSFREEAEMYLCLRGLKDGWQIREAGAGELRSMLCTVFGNVLHVVLDPIPEVSGLGMFELLSLDRRAFMDGLERN